MPAERPKTSSNQDASPVPVAAQQDPKTTIVPDIRPPEPASIGHTGEVGMDISSMDLGHRTIRWPDQEDIQNGAFNNDRKDDIV